MLTQKLTIESVKQVNARLFQSSSSRYQSSRMVKNYQKGIALLINGELQDGTKVYFFTPKTVLNCATGMLNYTSIDGESDWFKESKTEFVGHKNPLHYKGSNEMSVCIEDKTEIIPTVEEGETIKISFKIKRICKNGKSQLNYVKKK